MRTLFTLMMIGTLVGLTEGRLQAAEPPDPSDLPWADANIGRPKSAAAQTGPVVIAESGPVIPVNLPGIVCDPLPVESEEERRFQSVWGEVDVFVIPYGRKMAPNGEPFHPVTSLDLDFNVWLWKTQGIYAFCTARFWGKQDDDQAFIDGPNNTGHASWTGAFNLSKREFDLEVGGAWNYSGSWELRGFAYSLNNLNRGVSLNNPYGFNDGAGLENRYYLTAEYANLGREGYNESRAPFVSLGYYPTKVMVDLSSQFFAPGPFARAYLICDLPTSWCFPSWSGYLYADTQLICKNTFAPKLLEIDTGLSVSPFPSLPLLEFRVGTEIELDYEPGASLGNAFPYLSVRLNF